MCFKFLIFITLLSVGALVIYLMLEAERPQAQKIIDYQPHLVTRVYDKNASQITEISWEKRLYTPLYKIPKRLISAFLAAEDKHFYKHPGIDILGLLRAVIDNTLRSAWRNRPSGASTITQQVVKNIIVGNARSFKRKISEALTAILIENHLNKDEILEIYLNEIYLGAKSYGVLAAAQTYFNKTLNELTIEECAYLAALPKAPSSYDPMRHKAKALDRRNWVISRMYEDGYITKQELIAAKSTDLITVKNNEENLYDYFSEQVRRDLLEQFGEQGVYGEGLSVHTTQDPELQALTESVLHDGLLKLDRKRGFRGPITHLELEENNIPVTQEEWDKSDLRDTLIMLLEQSTYKKWPLAIILKILPTYNVVGLSNGRIMKLSSYGNWGENAETSNTELIHLSIGDIVFVEPIENDRVTLQQVPELTGGIVIMHPDTGAVLAVAGGFDAKSTQFNAATQALRQPGSCFKPFVYMAGLEKGYKGDTIIDDKEVNIYLGPGLGYYKPQNISKVSYGPTPMRIGLEKSRNQMTVHLAQMVGMQAVGEMAKRFGLYDKVYKDFSLSLGAGETTLLKLTAGYAMIANGGKKVTPHFISTVKDKNNTQIYQHEQGLLPVYQADQLITEYDHSNKPSVFDNRTEIVTQSASREMISFLRGAVLRGTAIRLVPLCEKRKIDFCAKTGTTNECKDAWIIGFTQNLGSENLVIGVFIGHPQPQSMGEYATGSKIALPFMHDLLKKIPTT
ncbi:MAG TPA: penicillin-binding protein [Holosporales bacterium]|nr:penicillin-binding protein [Holosporales bacterium]